MFEEAIARIGHGDPWFSENPVKVEWFEGQFEPGETALDAPILDELRWCHREMLSQESSTHGVSYGSDLRLFTRYASMPAVLYGPGDVRVAHSANESIPVDELVHATEVLTLLIARLVAE
jgi:acetylornithine deacetylase